MEDLFLDAGKRERAVDTVVTVKAVFEDREEACREGERLSALRDRRRGEYVLVETSVHGEIPPRGGVALLGLADWRPGTRVEPENVRLPGVWATEAEAEKALGAADPGCQWRLSVARFRPAKVPATR
jgi:hypothetical protein